MDRSADGKLPLSECTLGDIVLVHGKRMKLTAVNSEYAMLQPDGDKYSRVMATPNTQAVLVEKYEQRYIIGSAVDPLKEGEK